MSYHGHDADEVVAFIDAFISKDVANQRPELVGGGDHRGSPVIGSTPQQTRKLFLDVDDRLGLLQLARHLRKFALDLRVTRITSRTPTLHATRLGVSVALLAPVVMSYEYNHSRRTNAPRSAGDAASCSRRIASLYSRVNERRFARAGNPLRIGISHRVHARLIEIDRALRLAPQQE